MYLNEFCVLDRRKKNVTYRVVCFVPVADFCCNGH